MTSGKADHSGNTAFWRELVYRGVESDELDYKAAMNWNTMSRAAKGKIARHLTAFANTRGGYLVIGALLGYLAVTVSTAILPFALAFAGGTMLYVISDEMIPETHAHGSERGATFALLIGFCVMLATDFFLG